MPRLWGTRGGEGRDHVDCLAEETVAWLSSVGLEEVRASMCREEEAT